MSFPLHIVTSQQMAINVGFNNFHLRFFLGLSGSERGYDSMLKDATHYRYINSRIQRQVSQPLPHACVLFIFYCEFQV